MKKLISVAICILVVLSSFLIPASAATAQVVKQPDKTSFYQGVDWYYNGSTIIPAYDFDLTGTVVNYNGNEIRYHVFPWGGNMLVEPANGSWKLGSNNVNIILDDFDNVYAPSALTLVGIQKIEMNKNPVKTTLVKGTDWNYDALNYIKVNSGAISLDGAKIKVTYTDGTSKILTYGVDAGIDWRVSSDDFSLGTNKIVVTYSGYSTSYNINIVTNSVTGMTLKSAPTKTTYNYKNDWVYSGNAYSIPTISLDGLKVNVNYSSGSSEVLAYADSPNRFKASFKSALKLGENTVKVTIDSTYTVEYTIYIRAYGDVNFDGKINSSDALLVLQKSVGLTTLNSTQARYADVSNDNTINSTDALYILQKSVGKINKFAAE